jgi:hypothetical protein
VVQALGAGVRNIPLAGEPIMKSAERTIGGLGQAVERAAAAGGGASAEQAGAVASQGIKGWITGKSAELTKKAYDAVDNAINPSVTTELSNTRGIIAEIAARRQNAAIPGESKAINALLDAVQRPGGMNYQGIKDLRTFLGEMTPQEMVASGINAKESKQLYGALSKDLKASVEAAGGDRASALFERANSLNKAVAARRENLARLVGVDGDAPPALVFERLKAAAGSKSRADSQLLAQARKAMGGDWDEAVSGIVGQLGKNAKGEFSPQIFLNNWAGVSEAGKNLMFGEKGSASTLRQSLEAISTVSQRFKQLEKYANPSGTGRQVGFGAAGAGLVSEPVTTVATLVGGNIAARILASPASASSMSKWVKTYAEVARDASPSNLVAFSRASRNFGATISSDLKIPNPANDLFNSLGTRTLGGPRGAAAEDEQQP